MVCKVPLGLVHVGLWTACPYLIASHVMNSLNSVLTEIKVQSICGAVIFFQIQH